MSKNFEDVLLYVHSRLSHKCFISRHHLYLFTKQRCCPLIFFSCHNMIMNEFHKISQESEYPLCSQHQYSSEDQYKTIFPGNSTHCMSAEVIRRLQATSWVPAPARRLRGPGSNQSARIQTCKLSQFSCSPLFILEIK